MSNSTSTRTDSSSTPWVLIGIVAAVVIIGAIVGAVVISGRSGGSSSTVTIEGSSADSAQTGTVSVSGDDLPTFEALSADTAVGTEAPVVSATDFGGRPAKIGGDGKARLITFFAHWCPHCQRELPIYVEWMANNEVPENVEIVAVSTSVDPGKPNYPPYTWFVREGYDVTKGRLVRDDPNNSFALAYGLSGYPYVVVVGSDGKVIERRSGELSLEEITELINKAAGSSDKG